VWRVVRERLHLKAYKLSINQHLGRWIICVLLSKSVFNTRHTVTFGMPLWSSFWNTLYISWWWILLPFFSVFKETYSYICFTVPVTSCTEWDFTWSSSVHGERCYDTRGAGVSPLLERDSTYFNNMHTITLEILITEGHHWVPMSHSSNPHTNLLNVFIQIANNKGIFLKNYVRDSYFFIT
jgi:hypothetical protein